MTSTPCHCEARSNRTEAANDYCCNELTSSRSWPRGARYFCRHKSTQKGLQQKGFFTRTLRSNPPHGHCPAKRTEPRAAIILPRSPLNPASAKTCYAPAAAHSLHCSARFHPKLICCWKRASSNLLDVGLSP